MGLTYRPPPNFPPERMLIFGGEGTGKTNAVLQIARKCPDAQFYVIDTDYSASYQRMLITEFTDVLERGNVHIHVTGPDDWEAMMDAAREVRGAAVAGDWIIADSMSPTWDAVQGWFTERVHGDTIEDYLLEVRIKKQKAADKPEGSLDKSLEVFDGWMDWSVINPTYARLYKLLLSHPANLILTAEGTPVSDKDKGAMKQVYGVLGLKPRGQKRLGFLTHTVLMTSKTRSGEYELTTIKDRGRDELDGVELVDFVKDYLANVAGWKPKKWDGE